MSDQQPSGTLQDIIIELEVVPEDQQQPDIADVEEVSREIVDYLRSIGYIVEPRYTGTRGIPGFDIITHVFMALHGHEAIIASTFSFISSVIQGIIKVCDWRAAREKKRRHTPFEVTLEVNGKPLTIMTSDAENATKLVERLQQTYSEEVKQSQKGGMKIKVQVPKRERRRKR